MEYLFHRHSDLYAGAKGQRRIGGRKTAARVQSPASSRGGELNRGRGFKKIGAAVDTVAGSRPPRRSSLFPRRGRRGGGWKQCVEKSRDGWVG